MNNKYLVKIKGEGKSIVEIFEEYESCIHEGFNLTLDEIAEYLRCTYHHAQQHIKTLRYILITNKIRPHLIKLGKELDSDFLHFFYKRKLFSRSDFEKMFMDQAVIKISYERYFLEDFSSEVRNRLEFIPNHKIFEILGNYLYMEAIPYHKPSQQYRTEKLRSFPQKLLSSKDIEQRRGFSFSVETHRYIRKLGLPRVCFGNLVRYREEDIKQQPLFVLPITFPKNQVIQCIEREII